MKRAFIYIFIAVLSVLFTSCQTQHVAVPQSEGVGRVPQVTDSAVSDDNAADTSQNSTDLAGTKMWDISNGKYVYNFPKRDSSGLSDLSGLSAMQYVPFDDAAADNNDWYFGQTVRDLSTGEVTTVWDRASTTLEILEKTDTIYRGDESRKVVYLTFDCGYETGTMTSILDTLKEKNAPATFFVNGHYVETAQDMLRRMIDEGHIIANHCVNHYDLTTVESDVFIEKVQGLEDLFYTFFPDAEPMIYFRPPSGAANEWVLTLADKMGYTTVMWSWAYRDYIDDDQPDPAETLEKIKKGLHNGCVYLLHPESTTNVAILGDMIDWIRSQGYEILPICDIEV